MIHSFNNFISFSIFYLKFQKLFCCLQLIVLCFNLGCSIPLRQTYVKASTKEDMKQKAFEICGVHYRVVSYEDDTAKIECLEEFMGCDFISESKSSSAQCREMN